MTIEREYLWSAADGTKHDIRWMDSVHLVHSLNMTIRKNGNLRQQFERRAANGKEIGAVLALNMIAELKNRNLYTWQKTPVMRDGTFSDQLEIPPVRESSIQMCIMRAMWDTGIWPGTAWPQDYLQWLRNDVDALLEHLERDKHRNEKTRTVLAKFVEYRLARS